MALTVIFVPSTVADTMSPVNPLSLKVGDSEFATVTSISLVPPSAGKLNDVGVTDVIVGPVASNSLTSSKLRGRSCALVL